MKPIHLTGSFFQQSSVGVAIVSSKNKILEVNPAYLELTGYRKEEIIGKSIDIMGAKIHNKNYYKEFLESIQTNHYWEGEIWNRRKNGELVLIKRFAFLTVDPESKEKNYTLLSIDITDSKNKELKFNDLHYSDLLTGFPDKNVFKEIFKRTLKTSERLKRKTAVIFLDFAAFRKINDSFGYVVGDQLLKEASVRLRLITGDDCVLTRMGGDLFAFFFPEISAEDEIVRILEKITQEFRKMPFVVDEQDVFLPVNIGVSFYPADGNTDDELFRKADLARSRSKEYGYDTYSFYTPTLNVKMFEKLVMETNLRKAIEKKEFSVYYQPQVDIQTNEIVGAEALVRWKHPELGIISPAKFIPIAEEIGMINEIGDFVLNESCRQNKDWLDKGLNPVVISVNISSKQFKQKSFIELVQSALSHSRLPANYLDLEITESIVMKDWESTITLLSQLKDLGIKISIDDFGTGYSSLAYLTKLPLNTLKIDRSFIREEEKSISSLIISLAHELNLEVVAEGVETNEQLEFLKKERCERYQGYLCSPPVPAEVFEALLRDFSKKTEN